VHAVVTKSVWQIWEFPVADFLILARPDVPGLFILNQSARLIWELLRVVSSTEEAARELSLACNIPVDLASRYLEQTMAEWRSGLLSPRSATPPPAGTPPCPSISHNAFSCDCHIANQRIRVVLHDPELLEEIAPRLEGLMTSSSDEIDCVFNVIRNENSFYIFRDSVLVAREADICSIRAVLLQELVRTARGDRDWLAVFHAGACGTTSRCVLFPANTHSGKTTLAAALMHRGLTFYCDDSAAIERNTLSVPVMPFALTIREGSWPVLSPRFPQLNSAPIVSRFGQRVRFLHPECADHTLSGQTAAIVFSSYQAGAKTGLLPFSTLETLLGLQESGFWVPHDRSSIQSFLDWIHSVPAYSLTYSDVDEAATVVTDLLK